MRQLLRLVILGAALTGCVNFSTEIVPPNESVKATLHAEDCSIYVLGFGSGTNTFAGAMHAAYPINRVSPEEGSPGTPIRKIHTAFYNEFAFLFVGSRCLEVTGEP